jgi:preprotein translocase subunit SecA
VSDLYDPRTQWASYIINAIKAKELFVKDVNYIVKKDEVGARIESTSAGHSTQTIACPD